jgi:hypothetical protein
MNYNKIDTSAMSKVPMLSFSITSGSNYEDWFEPMTKAVSTVFGSKVGNAITEGNVPEFEVLRPRKSSSKATKRLIIAKNEDTRKQEIAFHNECDRAVATIVNTISKDSATRLKGHSDFSLIRKKNGLYNIFRFMSLVKATHQLPDNFLVRQSKKDELMTMSQGEDESTMIFLERVKTTAKVAYPDGNFDEAKYMSTFIKNSNSTFKALPTEEIFDRNILSFLEKVDDGSIPLQDRTLFKMISMVEEAAIRYNTLAANIRSSPAARKVDSNSGGTAMMAAQNKNGKKSTLVV